MGGFQRFAIPKSLHTTLMSKNPKSVAYSCAVMTSSLLTGLIVIRYFENRLVQPASYGQYIDPAHYQVPRMYSMI